MNAGVELGPRFTIAGANYVLNVLYHKVSDCECKCMKTGSGGVESVFGQSAPRGASNHFRHEISAVIGLCHSKFFFHKVY